MLNCIHHGAPTDRPGLVIVHGLYGSARNWGVIAKRLSDTRHVVAVDMRNHGTSPWFETHSYADLAADLAEVIESLKGPYDVLGHSMGGKAAMVLALTRPDLVNRLIVADIAPVPYDNNQMQYIEAMQSVDLTRITKRSDAGEQLLEKIDNPDLAPFFLQSIDVREKRWLLNLDTLAREMPDILGFPEISSVYDGKVMFLSGAESDYVRPEYRARIKALFPRAQFAKIPGAGHWLHAEKPREFEAAVRHWLEP
jgi:pimeloyl-ACP methyl ester carboxylesterase